MNLPLDSKLSPPRKRAELLARPAVTQRFARLPDCRLLLVCAPAGYGKTSALQLAEDHLRAGGHKVAWLNLDDSDRDLARFADLLMNALRRAGAATTPPALLGAEVAVPPEVLRTTLLNELALLRDEVFVLLDDYHAVDTEEIRALINTVLLSPVHALRFIIASRTPNALPLGRLRALGQVEELEVSDLTFNEAEVQQFVTRICGRPLSATHSARLRDATEGWAASLQMAAIALRDVGDIDGFLDRFSGARHDVAEFLGDEVFRRQPPKLQSFMVGTAFLRRFSVGLCDAVTGTRDGRAMLEELERRNLFLFALDAERRWFRYHALFGDFLRSRWAEADAALRARDHARASAWLETHGFLVDAIEHAFGADDHERAGQLLDRASADLFAAGQTATLMALSARLPAAVLERLPRLQLERAWYSELSWHFDDARLALAHVEAALTDPAAALCGTPADRALIAARLAHRRMMLEVLSDDMRGTLRSASEWLARDTSQDAFMRASASTALMAAHRVMFRCEGVQTSARMLNARYVEGGALYGVVFHQCVVGATLFERGDLDAARGAYEKALQTAVELQGEHSALYNMPALLFAELYYERDQLDAAEEMLAERDIATELGFVDNLIAGFVTRARLAATRGRTADAEALLGEGAWLADSHGFQRMRAALLDERLRVLERAGRRHEAQELLRAFARPAGIGDSPQPDEDATMTEFLLAMADARVAIMAGQAREAVAVLRAWFGFTRARHCLRSAIASGVLLGRALLASGDRRSALRALKESCALGRRGGFRRALLDGGDDVAGLLDEIARQLSRHTDAEEYDYLVQLQGSASVSERAAQRPPALAVARDTLSARELEILALGAQGLQNGDIARALFLAHSTVKWYWQRIFDKLAVRRRSEAIRHAREQQWVR